MSFSVKPNGLLYDKMKQGEFFFRIWIWKLIIQCKQSIAKKYSTIIYNNVNNLLLINTLLQSNIICLWPVSHGQCICYQTWQPEFISRTHKINYHNMYYEHVCIMSGMHTFTCAHLHTQTHILTIEMKLFFKE